MGLSPGRGADRAEGDSGVCVSMWSVRAGAVGHARLSQLAPLGSARWSRAASLVGTLDSREGGPGASSGTCQRQTEGLR